MVGVDVAMVGHWLEHDYLGCRCTWTGCYQVWAIHAPGSCCCHSGCFADGEDAVTTGHGCASLRGSNRLTKGLNA